MCDFFDRFRTVTDVFGQRLAPVSLWKDKTTVWFNDLLGVKNEYSERVRNVIRKELAHLQKFAGEPTFYSFCI